MIKDLLANNVQLITQILNLDTNIQGNIEDAKKVIERAFLDTTTIINEAKDEIIEKVELVGQKVDSLKSFISEEFKDSRNQIRSSIYLILKKMEKVPEITAKKLAEELSVSKKTIYSHLKRLQDKNLILARVQKRNRKGRPAKIFRLNLGKLYKIIKKGDD
ncbi:MAG: HTH domain-containing protein [Promethearchaeota archaeon]